MKNHDPPVLNNRTEILLLQLDMANTLPIRIKTT